LMGVGVYGGKDFWKRYVFSLLYCIRVCASVSESVSLCGGNLRTAYLKHNDGKFTQFWSHMQLS